MACINDDLQKYINTPEKIKMTSEVLQSKFELYIDFVWWAINNTRFKFKPFHKKVIKKLENLVYQKNEKRNLCLNLPVGSGKSIITELFITWCFARSINHTFCYVSHSDRLITKLSNEAKEIIESDIWQQLFGSPLKKSERAKVNYSFDGASKRTGLTAGTMGGAITGLDAGNPNIDGFSGALIIDDPIDAGNIRYVNSREECIRHYDEKLTTRRRHPSVPTILIMQRLHKDDLTGWIEETQLEDWDIVKVPALNEDGTSFWTERYPVSDLLKDQRTNPFKFFSQYQQAPITEGGAVIKSEWWRYYDNINSVQLKRVFCVGDTAQKTKEHNDYSVFTAWGTDGVYLYFLDGVRGKWESPDLKKQALNFWQRIKGLIPYRPASAFYVEDKASGTGLIQDLAVSSSIPIMGVQRNIDKLTRLEDVLPYIESGRVLLPFSKEYGFNPQLISEAEAFARDMSHKHDDIIDTVVDAVIKGFVNISILDCL